jgi:hypothetical protein
MRFLQLACLALLFGSTNFACAQVQYYQGTNAYGGPKFSAYNPSTGGYARGTAVPGYGAAGAYHNPYTGVTAGGAYGPYRAAGGVKGPNGGYAGAAITPLGVGYTYHTPSGTTVTGLYSWSGQGTTVTY